MMTCNQVIRKVDDILDGEEGWWVRLKFRMHLAMCSHCRRYVRQQRALREVVPEVDASMLPADYETLLGNILDSVLPSSDDKDSSRP